MLQYSVIPHYNSTRGSSVILQNDRARSRVIFWCYSTRSFFIATVLCHFLLLWCSSICDATVSVIPRCNSVWGSSIILQNDRARSWVCAGDVRLDHGRARVTHGSVEGARDQAALGAGSCRAGRMSDMRGTGQTHAGSVDWSVVWVQVIDHGSLTLADDPWSMLKAWDGMISFLRINELSIWIFYRFLSLFVTDLTWTLHFLFLGLKMWV
jgi:hypothetical protein